MGNISKKILESFEAKKVFSSTSNIFKKIEADNYIKFSKTNVIIPWYLMPFKKKITNIAFLAFKDGLSDGASDTVTIKRPNTYKPAREVE